MGPEYACTSAHGPELSLAPLKKVMFDTVRASCCAYRMIKGFDGSQFSGVPDMQALSDEGHTFAIFRTSSGMKPDTLAEEQIIAAQDAKIHVLAGYHYIRTDIPADEQTDFAIQRARELGLRAVAPDCEPYKGPDKATGLYPRPQDAPGVASFVLRAVARRYQASVSRWPLIYGGVYYLRALKLPAWMAECPAWISDWTPPLDVPAPWSTVAIHQTRGDVKLGDGTAIDVNESPLSLCELRALIEWPE